MRIELSRPIRRLAGCAMLLLAAATSTAAQAPSAPGPKPAEQPLSAEARARYVGTYEVAGPGGSMPFRVFEQGEKLMAQPGDENPTRLIYQGDHVFRPEEAPGASLTFTVVDGRATRFVVVFPGGTRRREGIRKP